MNKPKISVLMTIYNHENFLRHAIKSVINQTYKNWELIAIDNGSTDNSKKILKKFKHKNIKKKFLKKNIGRTNCLNYGLRFCKGKYIAILDSDDVSEKNRFKKQVNEMEKNKDVNLVASNFKLIDEDNQIVSNKKHFFKKKNLRSLLFKNFIAHSTVMYKKSIIGKVGNYPKKYQYAQDYAFYLKIFKKYKIKFLSETLVKLRKPHSNSETIRVSKQNLFFDEQISLLNWSLKNLNPNFKEKLKITFKFLKILTKKIIL